MLDMIQPRITELVGIGAGFDVLTTDRALAVQCAGAGVNRSVCFGIELTHHDSSHLNVVSSDISSTTATTLLLSLSIIFLSEFWIIHDNTDREHRRSYTSMFLLLR